MSRRGLIPPFLPPFATSLAGVRSVARVVPPDLRTSAMLRWTAVPHRAVVARSAAVTARCGALAPPVGAAGARWSAVTATMGATTAPRGAVAPPLERDDRAVWRGHRRPGRDDRALQRGRSALQRARPEIGGHRPEVERGGLEGLVGEAGKSGPGHLTLGVGAIRLRGSAGETPAVPGGEQRRGWKDRRASARPTPRAVGCAAGSGQGQGRSSEACAQVDRFGSASSLVEGGPDGVLCSRKNLPRLCRSGQKLIVTCADGIFNTRTVAAIQTYYQIGKNDHPKKCYIQQQYDAGTIRIPQTLRILHEH